MTVEEFEGSSRQVGTGPLSSLILVRTHGPQIERTGGCSRYERRSCLIEGELIGALAYGFSMADHMIGPVTTMRYRS